MSFSDYSTLLQFMSTLHVTKILYKELSENDNSKQQIYIGGDFTFLTELPFGEIAAYSDLSRPNFKAPVDLWWVNDQREVSPAPDTQLILYPKYPEVRLSGFMRGCRTAPVGHMSPVAKESRTSNNSKDGRVLILGITAEDRVYAYLALKGSSVAASLLQADLPRESAGGTLIRIPLVFEETRPRDALIKKLSEIVGRGWIESCRMYSDGKIRHYVAQNGAGYTLEAQFGIIPNGRSEPDFMGWELKASSKGRLTLMTPEPDGGYYREHGARDFAIKYGHEKPDALGYFTGTHKVGVRNGRSSMTLEIHGFDAVKGKITDVTGGIVLVPPDGSHAAVWSFGALMKHWSRKHAQACYIPYEKPKLTEIHSYRYLSPASLGEGTDFTLFLSALASGSIVFDPATKAPRDKKGAGAVKARSQFRIGFGKLATLYRKFEKVPLL